MTSRLGHESLWTNDDYCMPFIAYCCKMSGCPDSKRQFRYSILKITEGLDDLDLLERLRVEHLRKQPGMSI